MEHQDFKQVTLNNPQKVEALRKFNTKNVIIPRKEHEQKIVKIDENNNIVKINKISPVTSNFIRNARNEKKITQKEMAQKTNLPLKTINDIEKGSCVYKATDINKIAKYLNVVIPRN
jgi:DNA-binding XRE family transcriptional regulator